MKVFVVSKFRHSTSHVGGVPVAVFTSQGDAENKCVDLFNQSTSKNDDCYFDYEEVEFDEYSK